MYLITARSPIIKELTVKNLAMFNITYDRLIFEKDKMRVLPRGKRVLAVSDQYEFRKQIKVTVFYKMSKQLTWSR